MNENRVYYGKIAVAFIKGKSLDYNSSGIEITIDDNLDKLEDEDIIKIINYGIMQGYKMYKFKRKIPLPRIKKYWAS